MKICVFTFWNHQNPELASELNQNKKDYCEKFGLDFQIKSEHLYPHKYVFCYSRVGYIIQLLEENQYDWIVYVDADIIFTNFLIDIRSLLDNDKDMMLVSDPCGICAGSIFVRNTEYSLTSFRQIENNFLHDNSHELPIEEWPFEQGFIQHYLYGTKQRCPVKEDQNSRIKLFPAGFIAGYTEELFGTVYHWHQHLWISGSFSLHMAALSWEERRQLYLNKYRSLIVKTVPKSSFKADLIPDSDLPKASTKGTYILANDAVLDWTIAFSNSFRLHNPDLPLCIIPYDDNIKELDKLKENYNFFWYENFEVLEKCDQLWLLCAAKDDRWSGTFRKFACWFGSFQSFIYADTDIVVLQSFEPILKIIHRYAFLAAQQSPNNVWIQSAVESPPVGLEKSEVEFLCGTGFFASNIWSFDWSSNLEKLEDIVIQASKFKDYMEPSWNDQSFLNYRITRQIDKCVYWWDTKLKNYMNGGFWPGGEGLVQHQKDSILLQEPRPLFVHWAGLKGASKPLQDLWEFYRYIDFDFASLELQKIPNDSQKTQFQSISLPADIDQEYQQRLVEFYLKVAELSLSKGLIDQAIANYQKARQAQPNSLMILLKLGNLLLSQEQAEEASTCYQQVIELGKRLGYLERQVSFV